MMKTNTSVIVIGGNTAALRAQRLLRSAGINSKTVRRTGVAGKGCVYGLEIANYNLSEATYVLRENRIQYGLL